MEPRISNEVNPGRDGQNPLFRFPRFRATKLGGSWSRVFFSQVLSWTWCCLLSVSQAITTLHLRISWPSCFASISAHAHQGSRKGPLVVHHSVQVAQLAFLCTVSSQVVRSLCSDELFFFAGQPVCNLLRDPIYSARTNPAFPRHPPCPSQSGEAVIWEAIVWEATVSSLGTLELSRQRGLSFSAFDSKRLRSLALCHFPGVKRTCTATA